MINFKKVEGPLGIPIYYQAMPEMVKAVGIAVVVFTGSSDDESVGKPGLYHWLEHVPFRGTKKYPGGYAATSGKFIKCGGRVGAHTNEVSTVYWANVPVIEWKSALSVVADLLSQPLIEDYAVAAERKIIHQEIAAKLGTAQGYAYSKLPGILYKDHPFGHAALGSEESLNSINASLLRCAHKMGYDRSRLAIFICGNLPVEEVCAEITTISTVFPERGLSERRMPAFRGLLPWPESEVFVEETSFTSSMVFALFPLGKNAMLENFRVGSILSRLFGFGMPNSPLYRVLREENNLVYRTAMREAYFPGGGYIGYVAETKRENIDAVISGFRAVAKSPIVRSKRRLEEVSQGLSGSFSLRPIQPMSLINESIDRYLDGGQLVNDSDYVGFLESTSIGEVELLVKKVINPEKARVIVFKGMGS